MKLINCLLSVLFVSTSMTLSAQNPLAIINDPDGFTNIRVGPGIDFKVTDTLFTEDFFYFKESENTDWVKVSAWKGRQIEGYIHKSRIQEVEQLDNIIKKEIIIKTLAKQRSLADNFRLAWKSKDSLAYITSRRALEYYNDSKYDPILQIIPNYFCSTRDNEIIKQLMLTMIADKGSANEIPSFTIGECFICEDEIVLDELIKIENEKYKTIIIDQIEWGLMFHFNTDEDGKSTNEEYNKLILKLENER